MSRNLSVSEYGVLASVLSLISLPSLVYSSLNPIIVNFAAGYFATNQYDYVHGLYQKINRIAIWVGGAFFIIFTIFSGNIAAFFHIESARNLLLLAGIMVFLGFISVVNTSLLQAKLSFHFLALINFLNGFLKFLFGVFFIFLGTGVFGGISGILLTGIIVYLISFLPIRFVFSKKAHIPSIPMVELTKYALPTTLAFLSLTSFITTDILFVKHFYHSKDAGLYAGLSLIGKVIFFFSAPIGLAMFPLIVQKRAKKENYYSIFLLSMVLVLIPSVLLTLFYYLFPAFSIQFFLKNKEYLSIAPLIWIYGVYMTIYSLLSVITNYFLSIKKTKIAIPLSIGAVLQALCLWYYHTDFIQVILISLVIVVILLLILFIYYWYIYEKEIT
jgi:O-antigen/teichoic acid export membrane protein